MTHPFPRTPPYPLRVGKGSSGFGVFASQDIPKGRFIIEYWGKLVSDKIADKVGGRYLFDLENGKVVLGGTRKNIARYINHGCRPNAEVRITGNRIFIYSTKRIKAGEELAYDYGKDYFNFYIKPYGCKCKTCLKKRGK